MLKKTTCKAVEVTEIEKVNGTRVIDGDDEVKKA